MHSLTTCETHYTDGLAAPRSDFAKSTWPCLARTLRHLRWTQVAWRAAYRVLRPAETRGWFRTASRYQKRIADVRLADQPAPALPQHPDTATAAALVRELNDGRLTLLNTPRPFRGGPDWCMTGGRDHDRLWKYNLHYHGWLLTLAQGMSADGTDECARLLAKFTEDWLRHCRIGKPGFSHYAWNSYAIATRLDYWGRILAVLPPAFWQTRERLRREWMHSLALQAAYLEAHIEWDLRGNHLLRDAVGLATAGRLFEGPRAERWLQTATSLAVQQADEQMLSDGGHFEVSPFYHLEVMDSWLSLASLLRDEAACEKVRATWLRAAEFACWLRHPDGQSPQLNDGASLVVDEHLRRGNAIGMTPDLTPRRGGRHFTESGIAVWHGDPWSVFFDVGPVGPDYQPAHAHADTLTMECSFTGQRLFVDPGCHSYDLDDRRSYDRSTAAHNTVCIDGQDSSEVWHIFRVGRRARPLDVRVEIQSDQLSASAAHDGYRHMPGKPRHHRSVRVANGGRLQVVDRISGGGEHHVQAGWLLAPNWNATPAANGWLLTCGQTRVQVTVEALVSTQLNSLPHSPSLGEGREERAGRASRHLLPQAQGRSSVRPSHRLGSTVPEGRLASCEDTNTVEADRPLRLSVVPAQYHPEYGRELTTQRLQWEYQGPLPLEVCFEAVGVS